MKKRISSETNKSVRCAIYTRKSTEEGLDQEFNSLDAQRESLAAHIVRQCDSAVQYRDVDGPASFERPAFVRPVRARNDQRTRARQSGCFTQTW